MKSSVSALLFLLSVTLVACYSSSDSYLKNTADTTGSKQDSLSDTKASYLKALQSRKNLIDRQARDTSQLMVWVKVPGKKTLVELKGNHFPKEVETTYNLLKDKEGHVIYMVEVPYSESGDWFISYKSYFYPNGKLFAFERNANFFNGECTAEESEPVHERLVKYYNADFQLLDSAYTLKDNQGKYLPKVSCMLNYEYSYQVLGNVIAFKRLHNIP